MGVRWRGRQVTATLDEVNDVGTFVEFELMADSEDLETAKACIGSLADALGLADSERRSYLELLLEVRGGS